MTKSSYSGEDNGPAEVPHTGQHADRLDRRPKAPGRDDWLDEDLDRERLEPGLNAEGSGGAGADPAGPHDGGNSNT